MAAARGLPFWSSYNVREGAVLHVEVTVGERGNSSGGDAIAPREESIAGWTVSQDIVAAHDDDDGRFVRRSCSDLFLVIIVVIIKGPGRRNDATR